MAAFCVGTTSIRPAAAVSLAADSTAAAIHLGRQAIGRSRCRLVRGGAAPRSPAAAAAAAASTAMGLPARALCVAGCSQRSSSGSGSTSSISSISSCSSCSSSTRHSRRKRIGGDLRSSVLCIGTGAPSHMGRSSSAAGQTPSGHNRRRYTMRAGPKDVVVMPQETELKRLVEEVKSALATEHPDLPMGRHGRDDDEMIAWFLRDRKFRVEKAVAKLAKAIRWRHEFGAARLTAADVVAEAATGKAYLHSRPDLSGRPVIVVVASKHFARANRLLASQQLCAYLVEQALAQLPPGEEQFVGIFDMRAFQPANADLAFVAFMIDVFFTYYPRRLHRVLLVDAPFIFQPGWAVMKPLLRSYASLVEFCSVDDVRRRFSPNDIPYTFLS